MDIFEGTRHSFTVEHESESDFLLRGAPSITRYCNHASVVAYTLKFQIFGKLVKVANK